MTNSTTELEVLKGVVNRLDEAKLEYMLTGSFAMNYCAEPRMTRNIDIVVVLNKNDIEKVEVTFSDNYYVSKEAIENAVLNEAMFNIVHLDSVVKIDFVNSRCKCNS